MKKFIVLFIILTATVCFGADAAAPAVPAPASATTFNSILAWLISHQVILGGLLVAIFDFIFSINKDWESNSILHFFYNIAMKMKGNNTTPPAA